MTGSAETPRLHAVEAEEAEPHGASGSPAAAEQPDLAAAELAVAQLLRALGRDPASPHLAETPRRVAGALSELLTSEPFRFTSFPNEEGYDELVVVTGIPFHSLCEHHLLPFRGVAHVAYLPADRLVGLSKLARVVEGFARDLQVQERMTRQIVDRLQIELAPLGAGAALEAEHLCMSLRGVEAAGARTVTVATSGLLRSDRARRAEFLARCGLGQGREHDHVG